MRLAAPAGPRRANPDLVFLAIDSASVGFDEEIDLAEHEGDPLSARALTLMRNAWPWPREVHALVLQRLVDAGAKVVLFDLNFPTATEGDEPFRAALDRYKDRVVIGSNFAPTASRAVGGQYADHTRPVDSLIPHTAPMDDRVAYVNFWPDEDEIIRRANFRVTFEHVQGEPSPLDAEQFLSLGARALVRRGLPIACRKVWTTCLFDTLRRRARVSGRARFSRFSYRVIGSRTTARGNSSAAKSC